jgi:hypothetical protein
MEMPRIFKVLTLATIVLAVASVAAAQSRVIPAAGNARVVRVPGTSNPFLAGMPPGTTCCESDSVPAESPVA